MNNTWVTHFIDVHKIYGKTCKIFILSRRFVKECQTLPQIWDTFNTYLPLKVSLIIKCNKLIRKKILSLNVTYFVEIYVWWMVRIPTISWNCVRWNMFTCISSFVYISNEIAVWDGGYTCNWFDVFIMIHVH